jgi:hypothetical protein
VQLGEELDRRVAEDLAGGALVEVRAVDRHVVHLLGSPPVRELHAGGSTSSTSPIARSRWRASW